jgi:hypothetical protein
MTPNIKTAQEIKYAIVDHLTNKSPEFIDNLSREFTKEDKILTTQEIYKYRNMQIRKLYEELLSKDNQLFIGYENPLDFIEETLVEYFLS